MPACLTIAAIVFRWFPLDRSTLRLTDDTVGWPAIVVLITMILFVTFYAEGLGCVPWQANEFLPMEVRAIGTMMINVSNWLPNICVSRSFFVHDARHITIWDVRILRRVVVLGLGLRYFLVPRSGEYDFGRD